MLEAFPSGSQVGEVVRMLPSEADRGSLVDGIEEGSEEQEVEQDSMMGNRAVELAQGYLEEGGKLESGKKKDLREHRKLL